MVFISRAAAVAAMILAATVSGHSAELLSNGNFEAGYSGWTRASQIGSEGGLFITSNQSGVTSSQSGTTFQTNASGGALFSITDALGPGSHSLTQLFVVPVGVNVVSYSFQMFANNYAVATFGSGRDFSTPTLDQNAVVDILKAGVDPLTELSTDIVAVLFGPGSDPSASNPNPWKTYSGTLALGPGTYQIRFAETDNVFTFNQGVDNVSINTDAAATPLPAALPLFVSGAGLIGLIAYRRKRKR